MRLLPLVLFLGCAGDRGDGKSRPPGDDDDTVGDDDDDTTGDDDDDTTVRPPFLTEALALAPAGPTVRLAQRLTASTNVPTRLALRVDDGVRARTLAFPELTGAHEQVLTELHEDTHYELTATFTAENGESISVDAALDTGAVDFLLPTLQLLVHDGAEPGLRVIPVGDRAMPFVVLVVDVDARPVFAMVTTSDTKAVSYDPALGSFGMLLAGRIQRRDLGGAVVLDYGGARAPGAATPVAGVDAFHHEASFLPDGSFWSFHKIALEVPDYRTSYDDPLLVGPGTIDDDHVVHVAPDGSVLSDWSLAGMLSTDHIGWDSLDPNTAGNFDWAHANGVVPVPGEDAVLVSMRHQDTVMKVDTTTGAIRWIFAHPEGWTPELDALRLEPVDPEFMFTYHQHAPFPTPDGFAVYDNGNYDRTTPYDRDRAPGPPYTRLVRFRVDEAAMTVERVEQYVQLDDGVPLISEVLGNCDLLPTTGHLFGTFSYLYTEGGVRNADAGYGTRSTRLIEADAATGTPHWDLRLRAEDPAILPVGIQVDRATWVPSLYPPGVVTWE